MLCVLSPLIIPYYFSVSGDKAQQFGSYYLRWQLRSSLFCPLSVLYERRTSDCVIDPVTAISLFARAAENDLTVPDCLSTLLDNVADATTIFVLEHQATSLKRRLRGDGLPGQLMQSLSCNMSQKFVTTV